MSANPEPQEYEAAARELPASIAIPHIRGEMVMLRPAGVDDLDKLDDLEAFFNASGITGKDPQSERAAVHAWVRRSVAWSKGETPGESGVGDPESRRTMAWAVLSQANHDDERSSEPDDVIGMVFLIDIDGWAKSARIQVVLGKDYRGRGYSRDAMPRVMTYGFAAAPAGLGLHRIWVAVPEKNTRSLSVYKSLGFMPSGTSRDALWDAENDKYQDLIVMDTLVDEYDPIRSLDAFGMHIIEDNPGVQEALSAREHSVAIHRDEVRRARAEHDSAETTTPAGNADGRRQESEANASGRPETRDVSDAEADIASPDGTVRRDDANPSEQLDAKAAHADSSDEGTWWPFASSEHTGSKDAWWRHLGRGRKRNAEGK